MLSYKKNCLSVIQSSIDARNNEYLWVYSHPKVVYLSSFLQCHLLRLSARFLCCKNNNPFFNSEKLDFDKCSECEYNHSSEEDLILQLLGFDTYLDENHEYKNLEKLDKVFYRSSDDDITSLFKHIKIENANRKAYASEDIIKYFDAYFSRKHKKPIWKSYVEFKHFFTNYADNARTNLQTLSDKITLPTSAYKTKYGFITGKLENKLKEHGINSPVCVNASFSTKELDPYTTFIVFDNTSVRLYDVMDKSILKEKLETEFFYIFGDLTAPLKYNDILKTIDEILIITNDKK